MRLKRNFARHLPMALVLSAAIAGLFTHVAQSATCGAGQRTCSKKVVRTGGCCCKRVKFWDAYPRPELNPPDDIATLPDIEQQRFVKIFRLVPETVKVKSTQNYRERIIFMRSQQYVSITNKLAIKLARSGRMLAQDPAISPDDVLKMCNDTIVYGRSLVMGNMDNGTFAELAQKYGFKNAGKVVEKIEDKRNFNRKDIGVYPMDDPECRDFACLAKTVNPSRWNAFTARNAAVIAQNSGRAATNLSKKQMYDIYEERTARTMPDDLAALPNRERVRIGKMYDLLPVQVIAVAEKDYRKRAEYAASAQYANVRDALVAKLSKDTRRLSADPAITVEEILKLSDDIVRFGRPLVAGDMRSVSLQMLASRHGYVNVEKFVRIVEDNQYVRGRNQMVWPGKQPEFRDFEHLAKTVYKDRWLAFLARLRIPGNQAGVAVSGAKKPR